MSYRIGIGIGDVVEREGDLLGDGVNIAARLEGLAEAGGICISRAVHEQVTGKLSARFIDIGARKVKNIPEPVHAYLVVTWDDGRTSAKPQATATPASAKSARRAFGRSHRRRRAIHCDFCFLSATQRPDSKALSNSTAAVTAASADGPTPPWSAPDITSPPTSSTAAPAIRRTNSAKVTNRRLQNVPFNPARNLRFNAVGATRSARKDSLYRSMHERRSVIEIDTCLRVPIRQSALEVRVGPDSMRCSRCVPIHAASEGPRDRSVGAQP